MNGISRRNLVGGCIAAGGAGLILPRQATTVTRHATAFGTVVSLAATARNRRLAEAAVADGFHEIRAVERSLNLFDSASELSRLNRNGLLNSPSALLCEILGHARATWQLTGGAFDPTVQPLWMVHAVAATENRAPDGVALQLALNLVGLHGILISPSRISLREHGQMLSLNGIAQGYAADRVAKAMLSHDILSAFIDTGEIGTAGPGVEGGQLVGIRDPRKNDRIVGYVSIVGYFVATSGDYATTFTSDFFAHHIFDPKSGISPRELSSATVIAKTGAKADALSTGFLVVGRERALQLTRSLEGVETLLIDKNGNIAMSSGMKSKFRPA